MTREEFFEIFSELHHGKNISLYEMVEMIRFASDMYYSGMELISDREYDSLIENFREENPSSPLIAGLAGNEYNTAGYREVDNPITMGTLEKCQDMEEFSKWWRLHDDGHGYIVSGKQDGSGICLTYRDGKYVQGTSRGRGRRGFDKTSLYSLLPFPKEGLMLNGIPFSGSIRGEAELSNKNFKYFTEKKNPRNATAGMLNKRFSELSLMDIKNMGKISFIAYDIRSEMMPRENKRERMEILGSWGFLTPMWQEVSSYNEVVEFRERLMSLRDSGRDEYACDGIVLSRLIYDPEDQMLQVQKNSIAVKFDLMTAETEILGIEWSCSGRFFTPVAILSPVKLCGTMVSRASLCNLHIINDILGVKIGDRVEIVKRGEIIPKVMRKIS